MSGVRVLGRDAVGTVAESDGLRYYLTDCCGASAKGCDGYTGCRACHAEVDPALGGIPDGAFVTDGPGSTRYVKRPLTLVTVYGDGLDYDAWRATIHAEESKAATP